MNFFRAQDAARRKTWQLALLFGAAVLSLVVMTNVLIAGVYLWLGNYAMPQSPSVGELFARFPLERWIWISAGVIGVIAVASLYKYALVRGGGRRIAEALGGSLVRQSTPEPDERRLLNVVEEMAIASGVPVPPVYLVPEPSINAFAAGFTPDDAVIGINRGTVEHLSRDELQGVVAHEFSHILNGDTRINLRLIAVLHGILFIGMIGYGILRGVGVRGRRSSSDSLPVLALGGGLLVIGYAGTFFGNLIKAAVSRQREYLADAASVQFTRNPGGIAGALKKIGGSDLGSGMTSAAAAEASHMFFGQVRTFALDRLLATHPPIGHRIRAVEPGWDGRFVPVAAARPAPAPQPALTAGGAGVDTVRVTVATAAAVAEAAGTVTRETLTRARELIDGTDATLREAAHDPWGCRALVYAMLVDDLADVAERQLAHLRRNAEPGVPEQIARLRAALAGVDDVQRLALVEMAMPALKELSAPQYHRFLGNAVAVITADEHVGLFEWVLHRVLIKELKPHFDGPLRIRARYRSVRPVRDAALTLLSAVARHGSADLAAQRAAFAAGLAALELDGALDTRDDENFQRLNRALTDLRRLRPLAKPAVLKACAATVLADGAITVAEGALLQGIAATLDCPLPPTVAPARRAVPSAAESLE